MWDSITEKLYGAPCPLKGVLQPLWFRKHDDQVDALGLVGQLLDTIMHGDKLPEPDPAEKTSGYVVYTGRPAENDWMTY